MTRRQVGEVLHPAFRAVFVAARGDVYLALGGAAWAPARYRLLGSPYPAGEGFYESPVWGALEDDLAPPREDNHDA